MLTTQFVIYLEQDIINEPIYYMSIQQNEFYRMQESKHILGVESGWERSESL